MYTECLKHFLRLVFVGIDFANNSDANHATLTGMNVDDCINNNMVTPSAVNTESQLLPVIDITSIDIDAYIALHMNNSSVLSTSLFD